MNLSILFSFLIIFFFLDISTDFNGFFWLMNHRKGIAKRTLYFIIKYSKAS